MRKAGMIYFRAPGFVHLLLALAFGYWLLANSQQPTANGSQYKYSGTAQSFWLILHLSFSFPNFAALIFLTKFYKTELA